MKKILIILLLFSGFVSAQTYPGYTNVNARYQWEAGLFKGLGVPAGDSAQFRPGQLPRSGALYFDSTSNSTPSGLYIYYNGDWILQGSPTAVSLPNALLAGGTVTPLGGYQFAVQAAIFRIDDIIYASDSGTVIIDSSDATLNRIDRIYLARDELIHVLEGELATNALEPQVESDQIGLAFITIPAGEDPFLSTLAIYNENTESVVTTPSAGITVDGNNTTNVFIGTKSLNVTNINNGDIVLFTKAPSLSTWDITGYNGISMFIKLKAVMPAAGSLRIRIEFTGGNSLEVIIPLDKANITTYQAITIASSAFGNIGNLQVNRVRIRYVRANNTTNYTGFYLDNMFFQTGVTQPGAGNSVTSVGVSVGGNAYLATNTPVTSAGTINITPQGNSGQLINGAGDLITFPVIPDQIGPVNGRTKVTNALQYDDDSLFGQDADLTNRGWLTSAGYVRVWTNLYISNANSNIGDSLAFQKNDSTTGIKLLVAGTGITLTDTDSTIVIEASGGGGFFTSSTSTGNTSQDGSGDDFIFHGIGALTLAGQQFTFGFTPGAGITHSMDMDGTGNWTLVSDDAGTSSTINVYPGSLVFTAENNNFFFNDLVDDVGATKVVVYDGATKKIGTQDISGLGGGSYTDEEAQDAIGAMVDGTLVYTDGTPLLSRAALTGDITASAGSNTTAIAAGVIVNADINGSAAIDATKIADGTVSSSEFQFINTLSSNAQTQIDGKQSTLTNSAGLASALSDEEGTSGGFMRSGTSSTVQTVTNASGSGVMWTDFGGYVDSDFTLSDVNTAQSAFPSGYDVWTLQASTTYRFKGHYAIGTGGGNVTVAMGFALSSMTVTSMRYGFLSVIAADGGSSTAQTMGDGVGVASVVVTATSASAARVIDFEGIIRVNAGGTITPQITFSAAPGGTNTFKANSWIEFIPIGANTVTGIGPVN